METVWLIISILLVIIAGASKGVSDTISHHFSKSIFTNEKIFTKEYWNPTLSWKNKYKERGDSFIYNLIEKLDNTILVRFTDAWHCFNSMIYWSLLSVIIIQPKLPEWLDDVYLTNVINFTIAFSLFAGSFMLFYYKVLIKKSRAKIEARGKPYSYFK